jgi:hypothetical protein
MQINEHCSLVFHIDKRKYPKGSDCWPIFSELSAHWHDIGRQKVARHHAVCRAIFSLKSR